ncbi:type II toxin-antitoxin system RelE family toxin [Thioalkalivibrio sulfidiphilus]|uniref:type II toxin-antitoxin system RelE family toxin n=1 Tax=Thioalkalivibrio sulfidiphilus TaxID=1033854 RepID=UPI00036366FC|nr:type II toxin-antitoxin system RelE/ParE family toxin [Thioalkalivibrio sulfidiphilus]
MGFSIRIKQSAAKALAGIAKKDRLRLVSAIDELAENPYRGSALKGDLTGLRRIRVGNYRVVYEIREGELIVLVVRIAHRREVYRR